MLTADSHVTRNMTADAELAVLCHEMGHHLGGFPKGKGIFGSSWASNEGQADYYATMKCFRRLAGTEDNVAAMSNVVLPKEVKDSCSTAFHSQSEIALCERESMAGKLLAQVLYELGRGSSRGSRGEPATAPAFGTPSTDVVSATDDQHPLAQCRLDTYFQGSICTANMNEEFGKNEGSTGACAQEKGDTSGYRPVCWYKPSR